MAASTLPLPIEGDELAGELLANSLANSLASDPPVTPLATILGSADYDALQGSDASEQILGLGGR